MNFPRIISTSLLFLINNIIYIAFYGSALWIAINNAEPGITIFYISIHLMLLVLFMNMMLTNKIVHVEETTVHNLIYRLLVVATIIVVLIARDHWYLAGITLLITILSAKLNWGRNKSIYETKFENKNKNW